MSLADDGRRGAETLTAFTAFTFLTVAVTFLGVLTGVTFGAATLRVRVLRGVATVMRDIHLNSLIVHDIGIMLRESLHIETIQKNQAARGQLGDCPNVCCNPLQLDDLGSKSCIIRV